MVFVWMTFIGLGGFITLSWYASQPIVIGIARAFNETITETAGRNTALVIEYASYWWGPVLVLVLLLWAIISSAKRTVESEMYG